MDRCRSKLKLLIFLSEYNVVRGRNTALTAPTQSQLHLCVANCPETYRVGRAWSTVTMDGGEDMQRSLSSIVTLGSHRCAEVVSCRAFGHMQIDVF